MDHTQKLIDLVRNKKMSPKQIEEFANRVALREKAFIAARKSMTPTSESLNKIYGDVT